MFPALVSVVVPIVGAIFMFRLILYLYDLATENSEAGCTSGDRGSGPDAPGSAAHAENVFGHVHGLGVNPADDRLYVASHMGVFRQTDQGFRRIADRWQDTMAFTVVGADRFLASGHPDGREGLPPFLGLIESTDAGRSWTPVSLSTRCTKP